MMASKLLKLIISRVDEPLFDGEVISVTVPGKEGEMTLLALHEPLISPLKNGTIVVRTADGKEATFHVNGGMLEISNNQAMILV